MSYLVENPEDRFSRGMAQVLLAHPISTVKVEKGGSCKFLHKLPDT